MAKAFVIHFHSGCGGDHYDLMLEGEGKLFTWQLEQSPLELAVGQALPARRIADHRIEYLQYQGPVSRNRGCVARIDAGTCEIISTAPDRWLFRLSGGVIQGLFEISASTDAAGSLLKRISSDPAAQAT